MLNTHEAWKNGRPIRDRLPGINGGYTENEVADHLTAFWDELLVSTKDKIDGLPDQIDPITAAADWLDYLAPLCGASGVYWQRDWTELAKRNFLRESYRFVWPNKGTKDVLSFVLITLDILHVIRPAASFIVGESEVGDELGLRGWQYEIILPSPYFGTSVANTVAAIDELFGPCWCISNLIYDDSYFSPKELFALEDGALLKVDTDTALEV